MTDLLNCPFCDGKANFGCDDDAWTWIECTDCGMSTNHMVSAMDDCRPILAERWNRRAARTVPDTHVLAPRITTTMATPHYHAECREKDPLYPEARRLVLDRGVGSISYVQRVLRIGYNHAARLVEAMEGDILQGSTINGWRILMDEFSAAPKAKP